MAEEGLQLEGWSQPTRDVETVSAPVLTEPLTTDLTIAEKPVRKLEDYTRAELIEMDGVLFDKLVGTDVRTMSKALLSIAMARRAAEKE